MSYSYDSAGRAIDEVSPAVGSNTNRYQLNYDTDSTTVTDPLGNSSTYGFQTILGVPRSTGSSQPAGSGCGPAASTISYDANGNVASRTDFAGKITTYTYDVSRNLETQRVEASGTSNARTITTDWHGVWRLPTKIAEPRKLTSFIYNGDLSNGQPVTCAPDTAVIPLGGVNQKIGVLCRQTEQATTDSSGSAGLSASVDTNDAARNWNFTYDAAGRILTQTDPLGRVTTYAYYTDTAFAGNYDPYINQVSLLLHGNGADGSTTFVDSSPSPKTLTAQGNAKSATAQNKYGGASASFDGAGDYLTAPSGTEWNFAAGNFTVEAWIRFGDVSTHRTIVGNVDLQAAPFKGWVMRYDPISTPAGLRFVAFKGDASNTRDVFQIAWSPSTNVWYHVAAVRSGSTMLFFVDGQIIGSGTLVNATTIAHASGKTLVIGAQDQGASLDLFMNGHIDDLRISKGVARYTVAFTPPTQELPHVGPEIATGHSVGDLQSVSNPAGQVTNYDLYDKAGRVRKTTDLKGGVTEVSYTPRGWVSTVTVTPPGGTARTTSYTYDGIGQVTGVSLPDGTSLTYTYDDAHRLTAATDSRGNSVTYTLDAAGNRVGEEVRDPVSVLRRSIARSFDALNRVQQITGAAQ
jgi:YD repeat-containing protein